MYCIVFSRKAADSIKALEPGYRNKIKDALVKMSGNPFCHPYKKIRGETGLFRIRIGKFRMIYEVNEAEKRIIILKVDKRSTAYGK